MTNSPTSDTASSYSDEINFQFIGIVGVMRWVNKWGYVRYGTLVLSKS